MKVDVFFFSTFPFDKSSDYGQLTAELLLKRVTLYTNTIKTQLWAMWFLFLRICNYTTHSKAENVFMQLKKFRHQNSVSKLYIPRYD